MTWTQPLCANCWNNENPERRAVSVAAGDLETCCMCGQETRSGIYVRRDPATVPHPQAVSA